MFSYIYTKYKCMHDHLKFQCIMKTGLKVKKIRGHHTAAMMNHMVFFEWFLFVCLLFGDFAENTSFSITQASSTFIPTLIQSLACPCFLLFFISCPFWSGALWFYLENSDLQTSCSQTQVMTVCDMLLLCNTWSHKSDPGWTTNLHSADPGQPWSCFETVVTFDHWKMRTDFKTSF